jgi:hypothetical protein
MKSVPCPTKIGFDQNCKSNFNIQRPTRLGVVHIKTDSQVAYNIQLGRSLTAWKGNEIYIPMELVPCPNSSEINRDRSKNWTSRICLGPLPFLAFGPCIMSSPSGLHLGAYLHIPRTFIISSHYTIRVWVLHRLIC